MFKDIIGVNCRHFIVNHLCCIFTAVNFTRGKL